MIAEFEWAWSDEDDAPVFWFAMADMQWNYGRLQEEVKKKALYYLNDMKNLQRWEYENLKMSETVSYTHLDVYKRQRQYISKRMMHGK